jgi:hypothetical protein
MRLIIPHGTLDLLKSRGTGEPHSVGSPPESDLIKYISKRLPFEIQIIL